MLTPTIDLHAWVPITETGSDQSGRGKGKLSRKRKIPLQLLLLWGYVLRSGGTKLGGGNSSAERARGPGCGSNLLDGSGGQVFELYVKQSQAGRRQKSDPTFFFSPNFLPPIPPSLRFLLFTLRQFPELSVQSPPLRFGRRDPFQGSESTKSRSGGKATASPENGWGRCGGQGAESSMGSLFSNSNSVIWVHWKWGIAKMPLKEPAGWQAPTEGVNISKPIEIYTLICFPAVALASLMHSQTYL